MRHIVQRTVSLVVKETNMQHSEIQKLITVSIVLGVAMARGKNEEAYMIEIFPLTSAIESLGVEEDAAIGIAMDARDAAITAMRG